jgi:hypothetical protein
MEMTPVTSSQIESVGYDPDTMKLHIRFLSKRGPGSLYQYDNVDLETFNGLVGADSVGRYFGSTIKGNSNYPYRKLE